MRTASRSWLVRVLAAVIVVGVLYLLALSLVTATVRSPRALAVVAGIVALFVGLSALSRRVGANRWVSGSLLGAGALAVVWLLVAPALSLRDVAVEEALPTGQMIAQATATPEAARPASPTPVHTPRAAPTPTEPIRLASGELVGIDHRASGTAALYRLPDGSRIARLEDIDVENGPDYLVYVVPVAGATTPDGGIDLGALKGNLGSHNYPIPAGADLSGDVTVLIWCRAFAVPIAHATLTGS